MEQKTNSDEPRRVSEFDHENIVWHFNMVNRRMLIIIVTVLVTVCVTIGIIATTFVHAYTEREQRWIDTLMQLLPPGAEVNYSADEQPDS